MARTAIPVTAITDNAAITGAVGTAFDSTNNHVLTAPNDGRLLLEVDNTGTSPTATVTVKAGDNPPAFAAGLGDLTFVVGTAGKHKTLVVLDTARFLQDDGTINIDISQTVLLGTIAAYSFPRGF